MLGLYLARKSLTQSSYEMQPFSTKAAQRHQAYVVHDVSTLLVTYVKIERHVCVSCCAQHRIAIGIDVEGRPEYLIESVQSGKH